MFPKFLLLAAALLLAACTPIAAPTAQAPLPSPQPTSSPGQTAAVTPAQAWTAIVEEGGLRLVDAARTEQEIFPPGSTIESVTWSPDRTRLLVVQDNLVPSLSDGGYEIAGPLTVWAITPSDPTPVQLFTLPGSAEFQSQLQWGEWSPDGRFVTYWSGPLGASILADGLPLSVLDTTSGTVTSLGDASLYTPDYHAWSPDSSHLAITFGGGRDAWRNKSLAIYDVATGVTTPVAAAADHIPGWVAWSPDGATIAYAANPAETGDLEPSTITFDNPGIAARRIYLLDIATGESRRLNDRDSFQDAPVWSDEGETLYYVQRMDDTLQLMAAVPLTGEATPVEGAAEPLPELAGYYGLFDWSTLLAQIPD